MIVERTLLLAAFLLPLEYVSANQAYLGVEVKSTRWPQLISGAVQSIPSRLECAATCNQDPNCNLFLWNANKTCFIGSSLSSFSYLSPSTTAKIINIASGEFSPTKWGKQKGC